MCLILFAHDRHPDYTLLLSANRDEFYTRPTGALGEWPDSPGIFGGRDLRSGGTWLAAAQDGRWAAVTNYRDPLDRLPSAAPSRGLLISNYLLSGLAPAAYVEALRETTGRYSGFNLLLGGRGEVWWLSNRASPQRWGPLEPGVYGVSNDLLDTPWPKVERGKRAMEALLQAPSLSTEDLLRPLLDQSVAADHDLPSTGVPHELERALSAAFIRTPGYGTRSSTALLIRRDGRMTFTERRYAEGGEITGEDTLEIDLLREF